MHSQCKLCRLKRYILLLSSYVALCSTIDLHLCSLVDTEHVAGESISSLYGTGGMLPSLTTDRLFLLAATGVVLSLGGSGLLAHNTLQQTIAQRSAGDLGNRKYSLEACLWQQKR